MIKSYQDASGYDTIGFGHLVRRGEKIQKPLLGQAAERLLQQDITPKAAAVSLAYSIGEGALAKSPALKKINAGRHEEVPAQIKRWNRAGGKVLKGLERRREAEAALYRMRWY